MATALRERATVLVIRDENVLLVRDVGPNYGMPGGGIESGESATDAAIRELHEETGLKAKKTEYMFTWESSINRHRAIRVETEGDVEMGLGISDYTWWDRKAALPLYPHVEAILKRL